MSPELTARSSSWTNTEASQSPTGVRLDHPLTAYGHAQAGHLSLFLADPSATSPYPIPERVVASPFYRCVATAAPTARALALPIAVDHGVMEWYPPARPGTGLHPRPAPGGAQDVTRFFPDAEFDEAYSSTSYPSRLGETMPDLFNRIDTFVDAWIGRMDAEGVRCAVIFAHAATVIALGRALTGQRRRDFCAGCATTNLYRRRGDGRGESWDCVYDGKADYMPGGVERDWDVSTEQKYNRKRMVNLLVQFGQVELPNGEVVPDEGDYEPYTDASLLPVSLADGMERFLTPGFDQTRHKLPSEASAPAGGAAHQQKARL